MDKEDEQRMAEVELVMDKITNSSILYRNTPNIVISYIVNFALFSGFLAAGVSLRKTSALNQVTKKFLPVTNNVLIWARNTTMPTQNYFSSLILKGRRRSSVLYKNTIITFMEMPSYFQKTLERVRKFL